MDAVGASDILSAQIMFSSPWRDITVPNATVTTLLSAIGTGLFMGSGGDRVAVITGPFMAFGGLPGVPYASPSAPYKDHKPDQVGPFHT